MRRHSSQKVSEIKKMRRHGHTIHEITQALSLPKTTVWHHIQDVKLTPEQKKKIRSNQGGSKLKRDRDIAAAKREAQALMESDSYARCGFLAMLYWAEGNKASCVFSNTDGQMIRSYVKTLYRDLGVPKSQLTFVVRYFSGMNKHACVKYWSKEIGIPESRIRTYYNDGGTKKRKHHGICRVTVNKGAYTLKVIQELIKLTAIDMDAPVVQRIRIGPS